MKAREELVKNGFTFGHQDGINLLAEKQNQLVEAGGWIDIRVERVATVFDGRLLEDVAYQLCLAHPSGRGQQDVRLVLQRAHHPIRFLLPVAEIGFRDDTCDIEWVLHNAAFWRKSKLFISIIQIL